MNYRLRNNPHMMFIRAVLLVGIVALLASCNSDKDSPPPAAGSSDNINAQGVLREGRDLAPSEIDTLRAMKVRLDVVRDEYFGERGGVLGTEWCDVWYPEGTLTVTHGMYTVDQLWRARRRINAIFGSVPTDKLQIVCSVSLAVFKDKIKRQWWQYSRMEDNQIVLQPIPVLFQRGLSAIAVAHEYYVWSVRELSKGKAPRWIENGFAALLSKEQAILIDQMTEFPDRKPRMPLSEIEDALERLDDKRQFRIASLNAFKMVEHIVATFGLDKIAVFVNSLGSGNSLDDASKAAFNLAYDELVATAVTWKIGDDS